jgi:hypothetical protein
VEQPIVSIDLMEAARRSDSFPRDWGEERTRAAIAKYERFLRLAARHPGQPVAPTREIDVVWHLHMLSPRAYYQDCQRLFGTVLDHNGGFGKDPAEVPILQATFEDTARLWLEAYGEPYVSSEPSASGERVDCWHDCSGRCWHACNSGQRAEASIQ